MIEMKDVAYGYGDGEPVLKDVNLKISDGEFVGIIGRNGAGKTTLLKMLLGLLKPQSGTLINDFSRMSFLAQVTGNADLVFPATVREVVSLGLKWKPFSFMKKKDWEQVDFALTAMGVSDLADRGIGELSGGQQQRVRLAKALISKPDLLVMDEPTTGMDVGSRNEFLAAVRKLNKEYGKTVVLVTHFYDDLRDAGRIVRLKDGLIEEDEK